MLKSQNRLLEMFADMLIFGFQTLCFHAVALLILLEFKSVAQTLTLTLTWSNHN